MFCVPAPKIAVNNCLAYIMFLKIPFIKIIEYIFMRIDERGENLESWGRRWRL